MEGTAFSELSSLGKAGLKSWRSSVSGRRESCHKQKHAKTYHDLSPIAKQWSSVGTSFLLPRLSACPGITACIANTHCIPATKHTTSSTLHPSKQAEQEYPFRILSTNLFHYHPICSSGASLLYGLSWAGLPTNRC